MIAGTGANSTAEAIELSESAMQSGGAQYGLSVVPYYNKPTQEGMYRHFRAIAEAVDLPLILYNVPARTVAVLQTIPCCAWPRSPTSSASRTRPPAWSAAAICCGAHRTEFAIYSGEDATGLPLMLMGGQGVISVSANVAPRLMQKMCAAALCGDIKGAREANDRLLGLHTKLFVESNPIPVKWALAQMGLIERGIRLPLVPLSANFHEVVREAMRQAGIQLKSGLRLVEGKAV